MESNRRAQGSTHRAALPDSFAVALREATERLLRNGPTIRDVASAIGIAQFYPGVFAAAYDADGRYLWVSESFSEILGMPAAEVLERSFMDMFDPEWCRERLLVLRRVLEDGMPLATIEIFRGQRLEAAVLPVDARTPSAAVVYVGRFGLALPRPGKRGSTVPSLAAVFLETADWGSLSVLTRRELEVLRLIASGYDNAGIAERIHRTKRAVEWHIQKLYELLNCTQRTELFRTGLVAGLPDIDEAHWERMMARVRVEHHPGHEPPTDGSS